MYLVTLKKDYETETGVTKLVFLSPMAILKDGVELESEEEALKFNAEGSLMIPESYTITEDSRFLMDLSTEEIIVFDPAVEEDEDECQCGGNCKCKSSNNFYYAVVVPSERELEQGDLDKFTVELLLMRTDCMAPQFAIGLAMEGKYVIQIEREQFESLDIGDDISVYMDEYYDNVEYPDDEQDDEETTGEEDCGPDEEDCGPGEE